MLGEEDGARAASLLSVTPRGTFEHGTSTLQLRTDPADAAWWQDARARLLAARAERPQPARDDKVVSSWNGLAIAALADAGALLEEPRYLDAARECAGFLLAAHVVDGRLRRSSRDGVVGAAARRRWTTTATSPRACSRCTRPAAAPAGWVRRRGCWSWRSGTSPTARAVSTTRPTTPSSCSPAPAARPTTPSRPARRRSPEPLLTYAALTGSNRHREAADAALAVRRHAGRPRARASPGGASPSPRRPPRARSRSPWSGEDDLADALLALARRSPSPAWSSRSVPPTPRGCRCSPTAPWSGDARRRTSAGASSATSPSPRSTGSPRSWQDDSRDHRQDDAMAGAPWDAHALADEALSGLSADRQQLFAVRLDRWWPDLRAGLSRLYDAPAADRVALRLVGLAAAAYRDRDPDLHRLDLERTLRTDWLQEPRMLGYAAYTERFAGDLAAVPERLRYLQELGVTYLHLMPLLQDRAGRQRRRLRGHRLPRRARRPRHRRRPARARHVAARARRQPRPRPRAQPRRPGARVGAGGARAAASATARTSTSSTTRELPDAYEQTLPEVFPDFAPGSFTWDDDLHGWVWTTFNAFQWDVNWSNPEVLLEYADIVLFLANTGVEVLRLDAHRLHVEAHRDHLPEPAGGPLDHPGVARGRPDRLSRSRFQGGGDRRAERPRALPRAGRAPWEGQRPRLPQHADGAGLVDARQR